MFLGMVDEYHGARYSSGFPARVRKDIAAANTARPELIAFLTHLCMEELEDDADAAEETDTAERERERADRDFRTERAARHAESLDEARAFARRMIDGDIGWPPPAS